MGRTGLLAMFLAEEHRTEETSDTLSRREHLCTRGQLSARGHLGSRRVRVLTEAPEDPAMRAHFATLSARHLRKRYALLDKEGCRHARPPFDPLEHTHNSRQPRPSVRLPVLLHVQLAEALC